jgi:uncharacterized membrane protein YeaQ/YmgE (transglycosylase-associated protein family)
MDPQIMNWLIYLATGAVAGWLGSTFIRGASLGLVGNIIAGIVGSVVGSYLLGGKLGGGLLGTILTAAIGAALVLFVISLVKRV